MKLLFLDYFFGGYNFAHEDDGIFRVVSCGAFVLTVHALNCNKKSASNLT